MKTAIKRQWQRIRLEPGATWQPVTAATVRKAFADRQATLRYAERTPYPTIYDGKHGYKLVEVTP